jgi:hypothetical protein
MANTTWCDQGWHHGHDSGGGHQGGRAMTITQATTEAHIVERNRANAVGSTGPRTDKGKAVSRQNALKHGLCANPAAGVVEDREQFDQLHDALIDRFHPRDAIEAGLIHRVAVCLWRLQRAARIDSATANIAANVVDSARDRAQAWVNQITNDFWLTDWVEVKNKALIEQRIRDGLMKKGGPWHRVERQFLSYADKLRDETLMKDGAAITAMMLLIQNLMGKLEAGHWFGPVEAQMLAWLMGDFAERWMPKPEAEDQRSFFFPDETHFASPIETLIGEARKRPKGEPLPDALLGAVEARIATLRTQRNIVSDPYTKQQDEDKRTTALLPDAATLDRLIRYESHAERSLHRSLDMLAKLRGATIESVAATITGPGPAGTTVELRGQRTQWQPASLPGDFCETKPADPRD